MSADQPHFLAFPHSRECLYRLLGVAKTLGDVEDDLDHVGLASLTTTVPASSSDTSTTRTPARSPSSPSSSSRTSTTPSSAAATGEPRRRKPGLRGKNGPCRSTQDRLEQLEGGKKRDEREAASTRSSSLESVSMPTAPGDRSASLENSPNPRTASSTFTFITTCSSSSNAAREEEARSASRLLLDKCPSVSTLQSKGSTSSTTSSSRSPASSVNKAKERKREPRQRQRAAFFFESPREKSPRPASSRRSSQHISDSLAATAGGRGTTRTAARRRRHINNKNRNFYKTMQNGGCVTGTTISDGEAQHPIAAPRISPPPEVAVAYCMRANAVSVKRTTSVNMKTASMIGEQSAMPMSTSSGVGGAAAGPGDITRFNVSSGAGAGGVSQMTSARSRQQNAHYVDSSCSGADSGSQAGDNDCLIPPGQQDDQSPQTLNEVHLAVHDIVPHAAGGQDPAGAAGPPDQHVNYREPEDHRRTSGAGVPVQLGFGPEAHGRAAAYADAQPMFYYEERSSTAASSGEREHCQGPPDIKTNEGQSSAGAGGMRESGARGYIPTPGEVVADGLFTMGHRIPWQKPGLYVARDALGSPVPLPTPGELARKYPAHAYTHVMFGGGGGACGNNAYDYPQEEFELREISSPGGMSGGSSAQGRGLSWRSGNRFSVLAWIARSLPRFFYQALGSVLTKQILVAAVFGTACVWFNCLCQVLLDHRLVYGKIHFWPSKDEIELAERTIAIPNQAAFAKLVDETALNDDDVLFRMLPDLRHDKESWLSTIAELFDSDYLLSTLLQVSTTVFMCFHPCPKHILVRFLLIQGILFFCRGISIFVTPLPPPDSSCAIGRPAVDENYLLEAVYVFARSRITCTDVLFSGHTVNFTMLTMLWWDHFSSLVPKMPDVSFVVRRVALAYCALGYFSMIVTRFHYSVDIFIGALLTFVVWRYYHALVDYYALYFEMTQTTGPQLFDLISRAEGGVGGGEGGGGRSPSSSTSAAAAAGSGGGELSGGVAGGNMKKRGGWVRFLRHYDPINRGRYTFRWLFIWLEFTAREPFCGYLKK